MTLKHAAIVVAALLCLSSPTPAAEIAATVQSVTDKYATLSTDSDVLPRPTDKITIYFMLSGTSDEVTVAEGEIIEIVGSRIMAEIKNATGTVTKGHLARIHSPNPLQSPAPSDDAAPVSATPAEPAQTTTQREPEPIHLGQMASTIADFNDLRVGPLSPDDLKAHGIQILAKKGKPEIFAAQPNMVLPDGAEKVMLVNGGPVTAVTISLDPPVKRFTVYRVGAMQGASTPTWKMVAFTRSGERVDAAGEERGLPLQPMYFGVDGDNIARVELTTDNRHGKGTWATWNSLPIAGFGFDR